MYSTSKSAANRGTVEKRQVLVCHTKSMGKQSAESANIINDARWTCCTSSDRSYPSCYLFWIPVHCYADAFQYYSGFTDSIRIALCSNNVDTQEIAVQHLLFRRYWICWLRYSMLVFLSTSCSDLQVGGSRLVPECQSSIMSARCGFIWDPKSGMIPAIVTSCVWIWNRDATMGSVEMFTASSLQRELMLNRLSGS